MQGWTWEESRRELVQRDGHDFGCEAEGIFHTCRERAGDKKSSWINKEKCVKSGLNLNLTKEDYILIKPCSEPNFPQKTI